MLRFPEFAGEADWQSHSLHDISTRITEKVGTEKLMPVSITAGVGFVSQAEKFGRDISGDQYKNYIILREGEFAYNKGNSKKFAQGCVYKLKEFKKVAAPYAYISFRLKAGFDADFFQLYFEMNVHGRQLQKYITSGARSDGLLNIDPDDFFRISLPTPSFPEQQRIADCLTSLDEVISTESQKLDALKAHKKGLMQGLFPDHPAPTGHPSTGGEDLGSEFPSAGGVAEGRGGLVPRLRFPEFRDSGEWEEKPFQRVCHSISSGKDKLDSNGKYNLYGSTGVIGKTESATYHGRYILIARVGANAGFLTLADGKFGVTDNTLVISLQPSTDLDFVYYSLLQFGLNKLIFGSGQPLITGGQLKELALCFPASVEEQQRIAACLTALDELIAAQAEKISALKAQKKGLMQGLFPVAKEVAI
ncbi:MAG: restriction endonuclease subunit S [Turneriella sp.]